MAPRKTATKQPQRKPKGKKDRYPGVRFIDDPARTRAPWQVTIYHSGTKTRKYFPTFKQAKKRKQQAERLRFKEGSKALGYSREAHVEYAEAKRLVGDTPLPQTAKEFAARYAAGAERKTVQEAVDHYVATKTGLERSTKHLDDVRQRLSRFAETFGNRGMETIRRNDILTWLGELKPVPKKKRDRGAPGPKNLSPRSKWNFYGAIEALFNYAEREDWLTINPVRRINRERDLPKITTGPISVLTVGQGRAVMRKIEQIEPDYIAWACLQYFVGIRDAESDRFRGEWVERKTKRIIVPGWFHDGGVATEVSKTRDEWVIDDIPPAFWKWYDRYPKNFAAGRIRFPQWMAWERIRDALIEDGDIVAWPPNGFRHSTATYHLSAFRDPGRTSILLRHRNPKKLWSNYAAKLQDKKIGLEYLSLKPRKRRT